MKVHLQYQNQELHLDQQALSKIAEQFGTPCYVYSAATIFHAIEFIQQAFSCIPDYQVCYAVKANSNLSILKLMASKNLGFDIVSGGELARVHAAGCDTSSVIFSGVGKKDEEIRFGLQNNIQCFNVESIPELYRIQDIAQTMGIKAPIALRINPEIDANTHPYISTALKHSKFGIAFDEALKAYALAAQLNHIEIKGIAFHIGSQILSIQPFIEALKVSLTLLEPLAQMGIHIEHLDLGGGMGIGYETESLLPVEGYAKAVKSCLPSNNPKIILSPGRYLVGHAGLVLTRVIFMKHQGEHHFAIVDAAMNDLMRPALYQAWHNILPVQQIHDQPKRMDIVGPVCESGDFLGLQREISIKENNLLAILDAGAYGFSMSSNYNSRPKACEVLIELDGTTRVIRKRETFEDLIAAEQEGLNS